MVENRNEDISNRWSSVRYKVDGRLVNLFLILGLILGVFFCRIEVVEICILEIF